MLKISLHPARLHNLLLAPIEAQPGVKLFCEKDKTYRPKESVRLLETDA